MNILHTVKKEIKKGKRPISFAMAMLMAGMTFLPSIPGSMTSMAAANEGQQQGNTPITNPDGTVPNGNKPQDTYDTARVYVNNTPIRLEVSKVKTHIGEHEGIAPKTNSTQKENTITYKFSGRIEGSEADLIQTYGTSNIELAYSGNGTYLGYGWKRGTLEYLKYREQNKDEFGDTSVEIIYNEYGVFSGYAHITKKLETADDVNRYVAGATLTLYDALEIFKAHDYTKDDRFKGVTVTRNSNNDVTGVYVNKGYAGTKIEYVKEKTDESKINPDEDGLIVDDNYTYQDEINDTGESTWIAKTIQREDTPILYYTLNDLQITSNDTYYTNASTNEKEIDKIFGNERPDKKNRLYGFDRDRNIVDITQKDQIDFSIFAFEKGSTNPSFELVGGDLTKVKYNGVAKTISVDDETLIYHLDEDGNRDSLTDPQTGIAYVEEAAEDGSTDSRLYVWPVNIYKDSTGSETFEKIKTNRIATINADTENEYTIGTYTGTDFVKSVNPTLDEHGMTGYYQKSDNTYIKGADRYDRDGDYLGYGYTDKLDNDNLNAYTTKDHDNLYNGDKDDPFDQSTHYQNATAQKIIVTVDVDGNYIVNGNRAVPTPTRDGFIFGGWLVQPNLLTDGMTIKARWLNTGSMTIDQKNKWYSDREATGTTKEMTIEFDANGGKFTDGSGDIHSSDNKLYYRQGEAYLIENTWVTGESTPNDPFDNQKVNTIHQTSNTANDPYSSTTNGGMADMIKRISVGNYILEEIKSPDGYVKGLPVGITVNESDEVQRAEMVDTTIKIQVIKLDSTDSYEYNIFENGTLKQNPDGTNVKYREQTGSYSYQHVKGATLALKADKSIQSIYNNWIKACNNPNIGKAQENGNWYITFKSDKPIYLEGIPKGKYTLSELITPDGYVKAEDKVITVNETTDLVTYIMNDDHTKVEIKKYYNDGNGNQVMPNQYSAGLELKDKDGNVISSWHTDDVTDYTSVTTIEGGFLKSLLGTTKTSGFVENYENLINAGDTAFSTINWEVERTAKKKVGTDKQEIWYVSDGSKVIIENGQIPDTAPEGFADAYTHRNMDSELDQFKYRITMSATKQTGDDLSQQIWLTNTGKQINICVYKANSTTSSGKQGYVFEYKFNYKNDYTGKYENMVSYDTVDGTHRFDYIPTGTYILHESDVPEGFVQSDDKTFVVNETADIQYFDMENVRKELVVAKVAMDDKNNFFAGTLNGEVITGKIGVVIAGAKLQLYKVDKHSEDNKKAFMNGTVPSGAVLVDEWESGTDGAYTAKDEQKELIPVGYKVGDLKPHTITDIENGAYYLVEAKTPEYYRTAEPMEISVSDTTTASNLSKVAVVNKEMTGKIIVHKINTAGSDLSGAMFLVKNKTTGTTVGTLTTKDGYGELNISDIGRFDENGKMVPYTFTIQETNPPAGYAVKDEIHEFSFDPNTHTGSTIAINLNDSAFNNGTLTVTNDATVITIDKTDYQNGGGVAGTELQVFEATYENSEWKSNGKTNDSWKWTTTDVTSSHPLSGLIAGKSYVLKELKVPSGYTKAADMFFRISEDGNRIDKIWYDKTENPFVQFNSDSTGAIESIQLTTRKVIGSYVVLIDTNNGTEKNLGLLTDGLVLTKDEVIDGNIYKIKEIAKYSDNTESTIGTTTFVADLTNGSMLLNTKYASTIITTVNDKNGNTILSFNPDGTVKKIDNSLMEETQGIFVSGNGKDHETINTSSSNTSVIAYSVKVDKAGSTVTWVPDSQTTVLRTEPKIEVENNVYTWTTTSDNETIKFSTILKDNAVGFVNQKVSINDKVYTYMNPIAFNYGEGMYKNTSKLAVFNKVSGTDPNNETYEFTYKVTLTKEDGSPLDGSYNYRTKDGTYHLFEAFGKTKTLEVILSGDDFVIISDLPYGTHYSVRVVDPSGDGFTVKNGIADAQTSKNKVSNVLFTNTRNISSERELFKKNESYTIVENTILNDNSIYESAKYGFSIGENCEVVSFDIKNKHTTISIQKLDPEHENLKGARLAIFDKAGNQIEQWVSTGEEHILEAKLEPGQDYILREIEPAFGYTYAKDIPFTVSDDGTIDKIIMVDYETSVKILKVDEDGNGLNGATIQILDSNKNPVKARITSDEFEQGKDMIFTSKASGTVITGQLDANTVYYLRELVSPDGYYVAADDMLFTTNKSNVVKLVSLENVKTKIVIHKTDITGTEEIPGATITIKDKNGTIVDTWISTTEPHEITGKLVAGEEYTMHEESAPGGYHYSLDVKFTVPLNDEGIVQVYMSDEKTEIPFSKTDLTTGKELEGAHIQIKDKDGNIVEEWISTKEEHIIIGKLIACEKYTMHEEAVPNGYYYAEDIEFTVPKDKKDTVKIEMKDAPTDVLITKIDASTGTDVIGSYLQIKDKDGKIVDEWISDGKAHRITGKLIAGEEYTMHEKSAPDGYHYSDDVKFSVPLKNNGIIRVEMEDQPTSIEIVKTDATTGKELPGAHLQLKDKNGDLIDEWISTKEPHKITGELISGQKYFLYEEASPNGYYYSEVVEFTVPLKYEGIIKVEMKDELTVIKISKTDATTGTEIAGAKLQLFDKNGNLIDEWISSEESHDITGKLIAGESYTLKEISPPTGYYYTEEVTFTVPKTMSTDGIIKVEMKDKPIESIFKKTDFATGEELEGAHIQIKDRDGNIVEEWTSTKEEHIIVGKLIAGETFYMYEKGAPDGYIYTESIEFKVPKNDEGIIKVEMKDKPTHVNFKKTDITDGEELPGAKIQIKDESGKIVEEWISTENEHVIRGKLIVDKIYYMHEENAPDGYGYSTDIQFKVDRDNVVWTYDKKNSEWVKAEDSTVVMEDDVLKIAVMKVEKGTSDLIAGAKLQIVDSTGRVCEEWDTVAGEVHTIVKAFSDGTLLKADEVYTLVEISAPEGFLKTTAQSFSPNKDGTVRTITMEDTRVDKPWVTPDIEFNTIVFDKYNGSYVEGSTATITNSKKLEGAEYTIYRSDGTVYKVVTTGKDGSVTIPRPEAGTYFWKETKAPDGYMIDRNTYSFTITNSGNVNGTLDVIDYEKPEVIISKKDSETKELLPGAEFKILDSAGNVVYSGITESTGQLVFTPGYADTYTVVEIKAPDGYDLNPTYIKFIVAENGSVSGTTTMYNNKSEKKIGSISANYESKYNKDNKKNKHGTPNYGLGIDKYGNVILPKSGDTFNLVLIGFAWIASLGCIYLFIKKNRKRKPKK